MKRLCFLVLVVALSSHQLTRLHAGDLTGQGASQETPAMAGREVCSAKKLTPTTLPSGKVQVGILFGVNRFQVMGMAKPSAGGETLIGLPHNLAVHGDASWNRIFGLHGAGLAPSPQSPGIDSAYVGADVNLYDAGSGLLWSIPNRTRIVPYLRGGGSLIRLTVGVRLGEQSFSDSGNRFAGSFGGGARVHMTRESGLLVDLRAFRGIDMLWLVRCGGGFFYQFK